MVLELKGYSGDNKLCLLVSEIMSCEIESSYKGRDTVLDETQYTVVIKVKDKSSSYMLWYNGDLDKAKNTYNKVLGSLKMYHKKDTIQEEIKNYIKNM